LDFSAGIFMLFHKLSRRLEMRLGLLIAFLIVVTGCSQGMNPVVPTDQSGSLDQIPIIGYTANEGVSNALGLLGAYELILDPETVSAELTAKRTSAIGESFIVSGKGFFTITPCSDCFKIKRISLDSDGNVVLTFHLKHPFEPGNDAKPPTARNRKDLDIFDTACIVVPKETTPTTYSLLGESIYSGICVNPDGYTKELANVFSPMDNAVMPYFLAIDNSTDQTPPVSTYNEFSMGASTEFDMVFNLSSPLKFDLYLTFGYGAAARKSTFMSPKYYNPEFNRKAAWKVSVIPPTEPWVEGENAPSDTRIVTVEIYDWQTGADVSAQENYEDETDTTKVYAASEVSEVELEVLGVKQSVTTPSGTHTGMPGDPLIFEIPVANSAPSPSPAGEYTGIVKVSDSRPVATSISEGRDFLIDTPNGIVLNNVLMPEFATYQTFIAVVEAQSSCGPLEVTDISGCPLNSVPVGEKVTFTVTASNPDATHIYYEIDSSYNPVDGFIPDGPAQVDDGTFTDVVISLNPCVVGGTVNVAFHVYDDCAVPNHFWSFDDCQITIASCIPPVGNVTLTVNRFSSDHGVIVSTPWTLSWDPVPGAAQFAIYYDQDHRDGYTFNLAGVVPGTVNTYTVPASHVPANFYVPGNTYVVRTRLVADDPSSELADSERAFVSFCSFESFPTGVFGVNASNGEGWLTALERDPFITYYGNAFFYWPSTMDHPGYKNNGANVLSFLPWYLGEDGSTVNYYPGDLVAITFETPDVPDASVRRVAIVGSCSNMWVTADEGGIVMGAVESPTQPSDGWDGENLIWAQADSNILEGYQPYNFNHQDTDYSFPFNMTGYTSGNNCWRFQNDPPYTPQFTQGLMSANVGMVGDYVAIAAYKEANNGNYPCIYMDDLTVVIY
jgi:hypothetical protein